MKKHKIWGESMTTKEWLNRGWRIENEIEILQREKELAFERITSASCENDDVRVMKSDQNSSENKLINYLAYNDKIDTRIDELVECNGVAEIKSVCSLCGNPNKQYKPHYCPDCGAKMDKE